MTWSLLATIVGVCNGIVTFVKSIFGKTAASAVSSGPSATEVNKASKQAAQVSREAHEGAQESINEAQASTAADVTAVHAAGSLQDGTDVVKAAINRANAVGRADSSVRRKR